MKGWRYEGYRHSLAARGIKTSFAKKRNSFQAEAVAASAVLGYIAEREKRKTAKAQAKQQLKVVRAEKSLERERQHTARIAGGEDSGIIRETLSNVLFPESKPKKYVYISESGEEFYPVDHYPSEEEEE
jgi:hypothetical protein